MIKRAKNFAVNAHRNTKHYYDIHPYEYHLQMIVDFTKK